MLMVGATLSLSLVSHLYVVYDELVIKAGTVQAQTILASEYCEGLYHSLMPSVDS